MQSVQHQNCHGRGEWFCCLHFRHRWISKPFGCRLGTVQWDGESVKSYSCSFIFIWHASEVVAWITSHKWENYLVVYLSGFSNIIINKYASRITCCNNGRGHTWTDRDGLAILQMEKTTTNGSSDNVCGTTAASLSIDSRNRNIGVARPLMRQFPKQFVFYHKLITIHSSLQCY
jgi:hypothetical protein